MYITDPADEANRERQLPSYQANCRMQAYMQRQPTGANLADCADFDFASMVSLPANMPAPIEIAAPLPYREVEYPVKQFAYNPVAWLPEDLSQPFADNGSGRRYVDYDGKVRYE